MKGKFKHVKSYLFLLMIFCFNAITLNAQTIYHPQNCYQRSTILLYDKTDDGTWNEINKPLSLDKVDNINYEYAYDEKNRNLYVVTNNANVRITLFDNKETKRLMKNSLVPRLEGNSLQTEINKQSNILRQKFQTINTHIQDSIENKKERDKQEKEYNDSIDKIYFDKHKKTWYAFPINVTSLTCYDCRQRIDLVDHSFVDKDGVSWLGVCHVSQDKQFLYYFCHELGLLNIKKLCAHKLIIPDVLKNYDKFQRHIRIFADSIKNINETRNFDEDIDLINDYHPELFSDEMQKIAPYGFVEDYRWDDEYGYVRLDFSYTNTNKKTIKYIKPYFQITNDVNDIRCNGYFSGTGPLKQYDTASWYWDDSNYYVAHDASQMKITKLVITYMDGTTKILDKNHIVFK